MRKIFTILLCVVLSLSFLSVQAQDDNKKKGEPITITKVDNSGLQRPQKPSSQFIDCMYCDGSLYVSFRNPEGMCELTVTTDDDVATYMFDTSTSAEIHIGEHPAAHLLLTTEYGHSYQGDI